MKCAMIYKASHISLILKSMVFIALATVFFIFYFTDVVNKFAKKDTTLINSQETIEENERTSPFITFCMAPKAKKSIIDRYKLSRGVVNEPNSNDIKVLINLNKTIDTLFREVTYELNRDFHLLINLWFYDNEFGWTNYTSKMKVGSDNFIEVCLKLNMSLVEYEPM